MGLLFLSLLLNFFYVPSLMIVKLASFTFVCCLALAFVVNVDNVIGTYTCSFASERARRPLLFLIAPLRFPPGQGFKYLSASVSGIRPACEQRIKGFETIACFLRTFEFCRLDYYSLHTERGPISIGGIHLCMYVDVILITAHRRWFQAGYALLPRLRR